MDAFSWALLTAFIWGFVPIFDKFGLAQVNPFVGVFFRSLGVIFGLCLLSLFMVKPQELRATELKTILFLMTSGFLASVVAQLTFYSGLKIGDVSKVVPISASYPLITFILGILIFREGVSWLKCLGVAAVIAGIWAIKMS